MASWWSNDDNLKRDVDLDDIELIGSPWITVGVPFNSSEQFKKNVYAGACASSLGLSSIDYTYKKYIDNQDINNDRNSFDKKLIYVTSSLKQGVINILKYLMSIPKPDKPSLFAAGAAYVRLQNSFKGATLCLRTGLHFETLAIERMILEQLAWIYKVHNYDKNYFDIRPNKCIKDLKQLIPSVGYMYGILSEKLHIEPKTTLDYISIENENLSVVLNDKRQIIKSSNLLLNLYDMFCIIGEYIYADLLESFQYIKKDHNGKYVLDEERGSLKFISELQLELSTVMKSG